MMERILSALLGVAFLAAGYLKWQDPAAFEKAMRAMHLVPTAWTSAIALWLPAMEILCGCLALFAVRPALLGCAGLSLLFVLVLGIGLAKGNLAGCGCFGVWDPLAKSPWLSLARAAAFLFLSAGLYVRALALRLG